MLALLGACARYDGPATDSALLHAISSQSRTPDAGLAAAVFARTEGLDRAAAMAVLAADGADCAGASCSWWADYRPALIEIGPAPPDARMVWTVTFLAEGIDSADDLQARITRT